MRQSGRCRQWPTRTRLQPVAALAASLNRLGVQFRPAPITPVTGPSKTVRPGKTFRRLRAAACWSASRIAHLFPVFDEMQSMKALVLRTPLSTGVITTIGTPEQPQSAGIETDDTLACSRVAAARVSRRRTAPPIPHSNSCATARVLPRVRLRRRQGGGSRRQRQVRIKRAGIIQDGVSGQMQHLASPASALKRLSRASAPT